MTSPPPLIPDASSPSSTSPSSPVSWRVKLRRALVRQLKLWMIFLPCYFLSIGPMWWLWYSGMYVATEANFWVVAFYEPLRLACEIDWINWLVTSYIEWWNL